MKHNFIKYIPRHRPKDYASYDQDFEYDSPFCTVFAAAWAITWNTGKKFTNEELFDIGEELLGDSWWNTVEIAYKMAEMNWLKAYTLTKSQYKYALRRRWAVIVGVLLDPKVYVDARDWKIDSGAIKKQSNKWHAMFWVRNRWSYYLCNSYGKRWKRKFPMFQVNIDELIRKGCLRWYGVLITK